MDANLILQTKVQAPLVRPNLVRRPALMDRLHKGLHGPLTLICAPAGYGKTTLVAEWLSGPGLAAVGPSGSSDDSTLDSRRASPANRFGWLSLDESDNDPRRFLDYLLAALRQVQGEFGRSVEAMLAAPQPPPGELIMTALLNELSQFAQPFILVLDDYHLIHAPPIHAQIGFLLQHQPPPMHVVILTREDPPLPLSRMRARGQLTEIRQADLRFSPAECADFLQRTMSMDLAAGDVAALERRTEGWIAGLQLAALSMRAHEDVAGFIQAFTGSSRFILDYLMDEVFERQSPEVKDFLLKTSILERFSAPLCDAVTGRPGSRATLDDLERANLFIAPLDQARAWYHYHPLFAELLRQRLQMTQTISESALHCSASQWFSAQGLFPEAIHHALACTDWDRAARLVSDQTVPMLRRGELITLLGWLKCLPDEVVRAHPPLCRDYGWSLMLTGHLEAAGPYLDCAEQALQGDDPHLGQVMVAQAYLARALGDFGRAVALSRRALGYIAEDDVLHRSLLTFTLGFALFNTGQFAEAEPVLLEACEAARASGNDYARQTALGLLGAIRKSQGRLHSAAEFCHQALREAHGSPTAAQVQVFLASIFYEWNDLDAATEQLIEALKASQSIGNLAIEPEIHQIMAYIHLARGDLTAAQGQLDEFRQLLQKLESPLARTMIAGLQAELALAQGDRASAAHWLHEMGQGADSSALRSRHGLTQARLLLAQGSRAEAASVLAGLYEAAASMGLVSTMIEVRALQALAAETPLEAIQLLQSALTAGQTEGFIRTFVDLGGPMKFLLGRMRAEGGELKGYVLTLLTAFGQPAQVPAGQPLVEPISERELEILCLLAEGLSNLEIARRLVITVGTAKSHVHHILEKLGADSRMGAVARARELGLL